MFTKISKLEIFLVSLGVALCLLFIGLMYNLSSEKNSPIVYTDQDTGQQYIGSPNRCGGLTPRLDIDGWQMNTKVSKPQSMRTQTDE